MIGSHGTQILIELIQGLGIMALIAVLFGSIHRLRIETHVRSLLLGLIFGAGVLVSLGGSVQFGNGVFIDARHVFLGFASAFCGPVVGAIALVFGITGRVILGGEGALAGVVGMLICSAGGYFWFFALSRRIPDRLSALVTLGFMISSGLVSFLLLPREIAFAVLTEAGPLILATNVCGALMLGSFLEREISFIVHEAALALECDLDPLTAVLNRRGFDKAQQKLLATADGKSELALLLIDIDNFKGINDKWGHESGDRVLKAVGQILAREVRTSDAVGRIGGEEFAALLKGTDCQSIFVAAERIRRSVAELILPDQGQMLSVTVSIGLSFLKDSDGRGAYRNADAALYKAKHLGRNRIEIAA